MHVKALETARYPVYLVRHELPKEFAAGFRWTLVAIKAAIHPHVGSTYVAFETDAAAVEFATALNSSFHYSVVRHDRLGLNTYIAPDSCILVFESTEQLAARRALGDLSQGRIEIKSLQILRCWSSNLQLPCPYH